MLLKSVRYIFSLPICPALAPDQSQDTPLSPTKKCLEKCFDPHCEEKDSQQTCDGIASCYWCEKDKDNVILSNPYCGSAESCFRGRETPVSEGTCKLSLHHCHYISLIIFFFQFLITLALRSPTQHVVN